MLNGDKLVGGRELDVSFFYKESPSRSEVPFRLVFWNFPLGEVIRNADRRGLDPFKALVNDRKGHRII